MNSCYHELLPISIFLVVGSEPDHEGSKFEHDDSHIGKYGPSAQACLGASAMKDYG